jgi:uracil-DNA glycosylase
VPASTPAPGGLAQPLSDLFDAVPPDWREVTEPFRTRPVGQALIARVDAACRQGTTVYPA